jgi:hypothetical protein
MPVSVNLAKQVVFSMSPEGNTFTTIIDTPGINEGDILGSVSGNSEGQQRINFTFDIAFGKPDEIAGEAVLSTLEYLAHLVGLVVETFNSKF